MLRGILLGLLFVFQLSLFAQTSNKISGVITDAISGEALIGVTVLEKGTDNGVVTDLDGKYQITVKKGSTLIITYVGYTTIEQPVTALVMDFKMESGVELDEAVVVGYSTVKKSDVSSSISVIDAEKVQSIPYGSIDQILQGKSSGVSVINQNGKPGGNAFVRIRGDGSISAANNPIFILDGVEITITQYNALSPNSIGSVTVLKDAASAGIYGARGSNGVVLITSKKGSENQGPTITYTGQFGFKGNTKDNFDMMNTEQKVNYEVDLGTRGDTSGLSELLLLDHNWQDDVFRQGFLQTHDLEIVGGTDKLTYYSAFNYYDETGIALGSDFSRFAGKLNIGYKVKPWLNIGNSLNLSQTKSSEIRDSRNVQDPNRASYTYNPYEPVYVQNSAGGDSVDINGNLVYNLTTQGFNVVEGILNNPQTEKTFQIFNSAFAEAKIIEGLTVKTTVGLVYERFKGEYLIKSGSILDGYLAGNAYSLPGWKRDNGYDRLRIQWTNLATYVKSIREKHNFTIVGGTDYIKNDLENYTLESSGLANPAIVVQTGTFPEDASTNHSQNASFGIFSEARYNYDSRFYVTGLIRRDGSSNFGLNKQNAIFGAGSLAWNIANEAYLKGNKNINQLKLRASAGSSGNDRIGNDYRKFPTFGFTSYNNFPGSAQTRPENLNLGWEKNFIYDVGIDFGFFNNRISGAIDYYNRKTSDLLLDAPLPTTTGFSSIFRNIGSMRNQGVEVELAADLLRYKKFTWSVYGNFTYNKNEVLSLTKDDDTLTSGSGSTVLIKGLPVNTFFLPKFAGVNPANGASLFYDENGNLTDNENISLVHEGKSRLPKYYGTIGSSVSFFGVELSADFYYSAGNYVENVAWQILNSDGENIDQNQAVDALDFWKNPGDITSNPFPGGQSFSSDRFLQKGNYFRIRTARIGYTLPAKYITNSKLKGFKIWAQVDNIFTWTPEFKGDPEVGVGSDESTSLSLPGEISLFAYPTPRAVTFGTSISF